MSPWLSRTRWPMVGRMPLSSRRGRMVSKKTPLQKEKGERGIKVRTVWLYKLGFTVFMSWPITRPHSYSWSASSWLAQPALCPSLMLAFHQCLLTFHREDDCQLEKYASFSSLEPSLLMCAEHFHKALDSPQPQAHHAAQHGEHH